MRHAAIATGIVLLFASNAEAAGGVVEINQASALAGGITPTDTPDFPVTIDTPGSYVLTGNLTVTAPNTTGISIAATGSRVTLDLGGFQISGPGSCTGSGSFLLCTSPDTGTGVPVSGLTSGVRVQNGSLRGFGAYGIDLANGTADRHRKLRHWAPQSGRADRRNLVRSNGLQGILDDQRSIIRNNVVTGNNADGIVVYRGALVIDNETSFNGQAGIAALAASSVQRNVSHSNVGVGLYLVPEADPTGPASAYRENVVAGNGSTVSGGVSLGNNSCNGAASCP